ncbi:uncharacterized protein [Patagioenas fasciata]|uniref:uncharacterized protein isoform X2 n=1 Tax=Patagioenas fasciata TaxID=372321 RepID=UPI003A99938C
MEGLEQDSGPFLKSYFLVNLQPALMYRDVLSQIRDFHTSAELREDPFGSFLHLVCTKWQINSKVEKPRWRRHSPEICGASSEALAENTPSRSRKDKTAKAAAAATAPPTAASQAEATAPPQSSSAKVAADNVTSPASKANKAAPPSSHTAHCCCCNHSNHCDSHSDSENESNDGEPISASATGCKKVTRKTTRAADDGTGPTSTQGTSSGQGGDEVTTTRFFSPGELRDLRKDFSRREGENILTWLLWYWDNGAETIELEGGEARQLGSLSKDSTVDRAISRESNATTLWTRLLTAMKVRFPYKEGCISKLGKWNTMEKGIQFLRELAV